MAKKQETDKAAAISKKRKFSGAVRKLRAQVESGEITTGEAMQTREMLLKEG